MKTLTALTFVSALVFAAAGASAADLTDSDRSELRQRAEELQAQRARNPEFQPGEGRLNRETDVAPRESRSANKAGATRAETESRSAKKTGATRAETESRSAKKTATTRAETESRSAEKRRATRARTESRDAEKTGATRAKTETRRQNAAKKVRSLKKLRGAFVRNR